MRPAGARHLGLEERDVPRRAVRDEDGAVEERRDLRRRSPRTSARRRAPPRRCRARATFRRSRRLRDATSVALDGRTSVWSRPSTASPRTRSMQTSTTRSFSASRPVISRSTNASGASPRGRSHGGPGGGLAVGSELVTARRTSRCPDRRRCRARPCRASRSRALHRVDERDEDAAAARADRVSERDRAAADVDARRVELEAADARDRLRRERLVELDEIEVLRRVQPARASAFLPAGIGPSPMKFGSTPAVALDDDARERLELLGAEAPPRSRP